MTKREDNLSIHAPSLDYVKEKLTEQLNCDLVTVAVNDGGIAINGEVSLLRFTDRDGRKLVVPSVETMLGYGETMKLAVEGWAEEVVADFKEKIVSAKLATYIIIGQREFSEDENGRLTRHQFTARIGILGVEK